MTTEEARYQKMVRSIRRTLDKGQRQDVARHGADSGWPGFSYYSDTCRFYARHKEAIWDLLISEAEEMGEKNVWQFIAQFGRATVGDADQVENLLAWYALEAVCQREFDQ